MHVQESNEPVLEETIAQAAATSTSEEVKNAAAGENEDEEVKQALADFQNSLKDVLKDDSSAEQAMKDME